MPPRSAAASLAWERWTRCEHVPGVTLDRVTEIGHIEVTATSPEARTAWEACIFRAHSDQLAGGASGTPASPPSLVPIAGWHRPACYGARAVRSPWDDELARLFDRLASVASADLPADRVIAVADGLGGGRAAAVCSDGRRLTVMVGAGYLNASREWPARTVVLARLIGHELAHVALRHFALGDHTALPAPDHLEAEREADELAAYYMERAGIPCRDWVDYVGLMFTGLAWLTPAAEREAIIRACELARRGERPPRRLGSTRN
ncbi:MAG TPA: hypothetical protein VEA38_15120 [Terriglobales bacterium]|nr:hypothetical protein [Terriglobales bacterium]